MKENTSKRQSLKDFLQMPVIGPGSAKEKPSINTHHSRFASTSMSGANSGYRSSIIPFDNTITNFPLSPKPTPTPTPTGLYNPEESNTHSLKAIRLIKRISSFAKTATKDFEAKIKLINSIERRKLEAIHTDKHLHNSSPLLDPLTSKVSLLDLFKPPAQSNFNEEITLSEKKYTPLLIEHHRFVYFQIECARFTSPLIINILRGPETSVTSKIKVYVSKQNKKPSALSCDYTVESRNIKIYEKDYKATFDTPAYYFGIYSENRFEGKITYFFGEDKSAALPSHKKSQSVYISPRAKWKLKSPEEPVTIEEIREIQKEKMMKRCAYSNGENKVEKNKHLLSPQEKQYETYMKMMLFENRINEVLSKKKIIEEEKLQRKIFSVGKHDLLKTIREHFEHQRDITMSKMAMQKDWLHMLSFSTLMYHLSCRFEEMKKVYKKRQRIYLRLKILVRRFRNRLEKTGENEKVRTKFNIRSCFELHARLLLRTKQEEFNRVIMSFFKEFSKLSNAAEHASRKKFLVRKVEDRFVAYKAKKDIFKKVFQLIWDKYYQSVLGEISPVSSSRPQLTTLKSFDRKQTMGLEKKATLAVSPRSYDEKRPVFVKYMMEYIYYKYNKALAKYRQRFLELGPEIRKTADYGKFWLLDSKTFMKNPLVAKIEKLDDLIVNDDINLHKNIYGLYHKRDILRPPRLFCLPTMEEVRKAISLVAKGDTNMLTLESLSEEDED